MAERGIEFREYLSVLWARKWYIVVALVLVVGAAFLYTARQDPVYESSAQVLDQPIGFFAGSPPTAADVVDMFTEQQIASSHGVAVLADRIARSRGVALAGMSVSVPASTQTVLFTSSSTSPRAAQVTAQAYAEAYLQNRLSEAQQVQSASMRPYQEELDAVNRKLAETQTKLAENPPPDERTQLNVELNNLFSERSTLQQQLNNLVPPDQLRVGQILQPALLPTSPTSPDLRKNVALAVLAGLFLGVGAAVLRDRTDQRIRDRYQLEHEISAPVLALVPRVRTRESSARRELIVLGDPQSLAAEAHKQVRTSVLVSSAERGYKNILVTSPSAEEGKTATVANLGVALAQAGKRTVLISADLRRPTLHMYFGARARPGLPEVLSGQESVRDALQPANVTPNLYVLACREVAGSSELLGSDAMKRLLWNLQEEVDFVLIDTGPILGLSDALTLAPVTDSVLLVARAKSTTRGALREARHQLDQVDARVMGAVLTFVDPSSHPYGSNHYYYSHRRPLDDAALTPAPPPRSGELHPLSAEP